MNIKMNRKSPQIIACPACGYTFKPPLGKPNFKCPMCGYEFKSEDNYSQKDDFDQRII